MRTSHLGPVHAMIIVFYLALLLTQVGATLMDRVRGWVGPIRHGGKGTNEHGLGSGDVTTPSFSLGEPGVVAEASKTTELTSQDVNHLLHDPIQGKRPINEKIFELIGLSDEEMKLNRDSFFYSKSPGKSDVDFGIAPNIVTIPKLSEGTSEKAKQITAVARIVEMLFSKHNGDVFLVTFNQKDKNSVLLIHHLGMAKEKIGLNPLFDVPTDFLEKNMWKNQALIMEGMRNIVKGIFPRGKPVLEKGVLKAGILEGDSFMGYGEQEQSSSLQGKFQLMLAVKINKDGLPYGEVSQKLREMVVMEAQIKREKKNAEKVRKHEGQLITEVLEQNPEIPGGIKALYKSLQR